MLEEKRRQKEEQYAQRLSKVHAQAPRVRAIDTELRLTMAELVGVALGSDEGSKVEDIRVRNLELQQERKNEIKRARFPENYLDDEYMCLKCRDTGFVASKMCECLRGIYKEEQKSSLSNLFKLGKETFDSFDLSYYDDTTAQETSISPRRSMEVVYEICVEYARKFGSRS